jgi:hypothetical protein
MQHAYLIIHPQLFIAVITRCSTNFGTAADSTNNFAHADTLFRMSSLSGRMNIGRVNIEFFRGWKKIKQRRKSFFLGYLRMIL